MGDDDMIRRGDALALRDNLADIIGARPMSSIHSALSEYHNAIRALPAAPAEDVRAGAQAQAREAWRIAGMVTNNDEAMQVHQAICALFKIDTARPDDAQEAKP